MKGDAKCGKWGGGFGVRIGNLKSMEIAPLDKTHTSFY